MTEKYPALGSVLSSLLNHWLMERVAFYSSTLLFVWIHLLSFTVFLISFESRYWSCML